MIIMLLAHLQASGDASLIKQHYDLIRGWAEYLVQFAMNPGNQQSSPSDGTGIFNQTNLALKGIIGIGVMSKISSFLKKTSDAAKYNATAESYIEQWQTLSISQDKTRLLTSFNSENSAGLIYNLYADKLLRLELVPQSVYDIQTSYYKSQIAFSRFGVPLDISNETMTRADWMPFAAAASSDTEVQSSLISLVHSYAFAPGSARAVTPLYNPASGTSSANGINSPSMGALFSVLASRIPFKVNISATQLGNGGIIPKKKVVTVVGGVVGGVAGLMFIGLGVITYMYVMRERRTESGRWSDAAWITPWLHYVSEASRSALPSGRATMEKIQKRKTRRELAGGETHWNAVSGASSGVIKAESLAPPSYTSEDPVDP